MRTASVLLIFMVTSLQLKVSYLSFRAQRVFCAPVGSTGRGPLPLRAGFARGPLPLRAVFARRICFSFSLMKVAAVSPCSGAACLPKAGLLRSSLKVRFGNSDLGLTFSELGIFRP